MNTDIIQGHWHEIKGIIKQKWGKFTDDDVAQMKGSQEELLGWLQKKYGFKRDKAEEEVESFIKSNKWVH